MYQYNKCGVYMMDVIVEDLVNKYWKSIKKRKNIIGFSGKLRPKITAGKEHIDKMSFRIYVVKKHKVEELKPRDIVPRMLSLGESSIITDIVEIGVIKALNNKERRRPICSGISTMHKDGTACTINGFFRDTVTGQIYVASNNHCYALENKAKIGDPCLQPGPHDGGKYPEDEIGKLVKYVEILFNEFECPYRDIVVKIKRKLFGPKQLFNKVDMAFDSMSVPYEVIATYIGEFKGRTIFNIGDKVTKSGRTTEQTFGELFDTDWNGMIQYSRGIAFFTDCYLITGDKFSQGGDSGSPVFNMNNEYGGCLFAGSDTTSIVAKLENIEEEGGVELITS